MKCNAFCTATSYRFRELQDYFQGIGKTIIYSDTIHLQKYKGDIFIFSYGVVVFWGLMADDEFRILADLKRFEDEPLEIPVSDEFTYSEKMGTFLIRPKTDHIQLASDENIEKLAVSYAIMQSVKLTMFEETTEETIEDTKHISEDLAEKGKISLSRKAISKMRGKLYMQRRYINLHSQLLGTPNFFWEYPELENTYLSASKHLEVNARVEVLNKKLAIIHEMFEMLADEQKHKHSAMLEWIIILLILVEVGFMLQDKFMR